MRIIYSCMAIAACFLVACSGSTTLTVGGDSTAIKQEKNRLTALTAEKALSNKDVDAVVASCSADFVDYGSGEDKPMKNLDTVKAGLKAYLNAFPDYKGENFNAFAHGDSVIVTATWSGTFKNELMGIKPTGKSFKYNDADIFTFNKDGKVTSHRSVQSMATAFTQLGIPLGPPEKK